MGKCNSVVKEMRFVIEDELTHCYVIVDAFGDCPIGVQGCHYKAFGASKSVMDICEAIRQGDDFLLWPLNAPEQR